MSQCSSKLEHWRDGSAYRGAVRRPHYRPLGTDITLRRDSDHEPFRDNGAQP